MKVEDVMFAQREARRFMEKVEDFLSNPMATEGSKIGVGTRASGALRRTSLDLTRALAEMRRREK
jgi:hypothetical protein